MRFLQRKPTRILISILFFIQLACNATVTVFNPTSTAQPPSPLPALPTATSIASLSQQVTLVSVPFSEADPGTNFPKYTITSETPQLTGSNDARVLAFNQRLDGLVKKEVESFRQSFKQLPITPYTNGSSLDIKYTLLWQTGSLWSFKFDFDFYSDGAAHPGLYSVTLNYDLDQGRELALSDLFLPNASYLEALSTYCRAELGKQPYGDSFFLDGANPTPENYRNWNITSDGLLITFDEYQVAPYAAGPQKVLIPYSELTSILNPQGPLATVLQP